MSYGLRTRDSAGNITMDNTDNLCVIRYTALLPESDIDSVDLSDLSGRSFVAFAVPVYGTGFGQIHKVTVSGTTISWSNGGDDSYTFGPSQLFVLVYG